MTCKGGAAGCAGDMHHGSQTQLTDAALAQVVQTRAHPTAHVSLLLFLQDLLA